MLRKDTQIHRAVALPIRNRCRVETLLTIAAYSVLVSISVTTSHRRAPIPWVLLEGSPVHRITRSVCSLATIAFETDRHKRSNDHKVGSLLVNAPLNDFLDTDALWTGRRLSADCNSVAFRETLTT